MRVFLVACFAISSAWNSSAQAIDDSAEATPRRGVNATDSDVKAGLREALAIASMNAIKKTAIENGFWGNEAIKVQLPEKLLNSENGLRLMGQGLKIEDLKLSMNRVAEAATPAAAEVFSKAITEKTFPELRKVLNGRGAAATEDLRRSAFSAMQKSFKPAVMSAMARTDIQSQFNSLAAQYTGLTLGDKCEVDLADYLAGSILAGLFSVTAQEEVNLRADPQGQSELLKKVFLTE